jgi:hypothetical protein
MVTQLLLKRILIGGSILTAIVAPILVLALYINPRMALSDYPEDVKAAVPPRTKKELRQGIVMSIPLLVAVIAVPLYSTWVVKQQNQGVITYWMSFVTIFGVFLIPFLFDLIVLDILMFYTWTPKFLVIPGTEGMPGYKDWRPHLKAHLTKGLLLLVAFSALLALIPKYLY